jgi:hypothetical protein
MACCPEEGDAMPLLDHSKLPALSKRSWEGFHTVWAAGITHDQNTNRLPARYHAEPLTWTGLEVEADVSTFEEDAVPLDAGEGNGEAGGTATAVWAPPQPPLVTQVEFGNLDVYEVRVYDYEATVALVAAIELISPANKDGPAARNGFATKCAAYLQQSVSVVVVDPIMERSQNLHEEIMRRLRLGDDMVNAVTSDLHAVADRTAGIGTRMRLEAWPATLTVGAALPTLPLWIARPGRATRP